MSEMSEQGGEREAIAEDVRALEALGYRQELRRAMSGFANFSLSFSIICILAGGVTSFHLGFCGAGGAAIGLGWPLFSIYSLIVALTMGQVAVPELQRRNYHPALTTGSLAAGGTLGIMIPPSIPMIIYAVTVQASIIDLFMAGIMPGIVLTLMFMAWIYIYVRRHPDHAPRDPSVPALNPLRMLAAFGDCIALILLIGATIGSLYFGLVTPTEAGAFGTLVALFIGVFYGELTLAKLKIALNRTVLTTVVVFYIIVTGALLSFGMVDAGIARGVSNAVVDAGL